MKTPPPIPKTASSKSAMFTDNPKSSCRKRGGVVLAIGVAIFVVTVVVPLGETSGLLGGVLFSAATLAGSIESITGCPFWQLKAQWTGLKGWQQFSLVVILAPLGFSLIFSTVFLAYSISPWKSPVVPWSG